jgi:uncharacterized protein (TIRG00374 family)
LETSRPLKNFLITVLKVGISLAILAYLIVKATNDRAFAELSSQSKDWGVLAAAFAAFFGNILLCNIRWYYLVRALDLPFTLREAMRLGFLGYLFNLAPTGIVGGDLLKAVMLSRHLGGQRAKAMASVVADRVIGLYILFVVASVAIVITRFWRVDPQIYRIAVGTLALTAVATLAMAVLFIPGITGGRLTQSLANSSRAGQALERLITELRMYQTNLPTLVASGLMTVGVHAFFILGIYLTARGLYHHVVPLAMQCVVVPLSGATAVIPLPMGPFEVVLDFLYGRFGLPHQGLIVALGYRILSVLIAFVGVCYYLSSRQEVAAVMHEEETQEHEPLDVVPAAPHNLPWSDKGAGD